MGVTLKGKLPLANIASVEEAMYSAMVKIGKIGVEYAINSHGFQNRTFNLQDSYGYAVFKDGQMMGTPVMAVKKAKEPIIFEGLSYSGQEEGKNLLEDFQAPMGWSVVVVAGMVYASFVEEYYGLDVLQGSEQEAKVNTEEIFKEIPWESLLKN